MSELIKKHLAAYSAGNWDDFKAALAPDALYEEIASGQRFKGADQYVDAVRRWKSAFPDLKATVVNMTGTDDFCVVEVDWEGTQSGPLEGPFGTIPASNRSGHIRGALLYQVKDDKIVALRHYFDLLGMLMQLGVAPSAGAPAGKAAATEAAEQPRH